jgi:tape measure domain-containing protein
MAKLGDLIVRIGADTRDLNKSLGRVQRNMRSMTSNFERLGQNMTRSLTLPIAAFGAAAVKSAADLEQLETSFVSLTGGAEQAAMMMKQLNEFTAQTPFQIEAVANAARQLIASGTEIGDVNQQLQFLGDIAATSGNSIEEIAAIFAKVNAKGKVELENLNQLAERGIPIFTALADATGLPADKLGAGAVSVQQFNDVLKGFAEQGGFAQGAMERLSKTASGRFSTAMDNLKLALANVGDQLLPFVNKGLERFTKLMQGFARLSPTTLKLAASIAALVGAIGPLLIAVPKIVASIKLMNFAFLTTAPGVLALSVALGAIAGVFLRVRKEAKAATKETKQQEAALISLNKTQLALETGIKLTGDATEDLNRINAAREDSLRRVAQANAELQTLEEAQREGDAIVKAGLRDKIKSLREYIDTYQRSADAADQLIVVLDREQKALQSATETTDQFNESSAATATTLGQLFSELENVTVGTHQAKMSMGEFFSMLENVQVQAEATKQQFIDMGDVIRQALTGIAGAFDGTGNFIMKGLRVLGGLMVNIGSQMIALATTMKAFRKFIITNPGLAIAAGVGFIIAGQALSNMAQRNLEVPALAQGGVAYGPTMAMIGDNRNAAIDPEVVAPLSKLRDMMGGNQVEVFGRIQGNDIFLSNARTGTSRNRYS